ncbi:MAG TPA: hypothetical protein VKB80_37475 [Kofleriaceae bacterium]|nr:hypothetical protein [Kofleriaceae bacterium]
MSTVRPAIPPRPVAIYSHTKGQQWGLAILAWERGARRAYQFEDGALRIFTEEYYALLEEVDAPADKAARVIADLRRKLGDASHHDSSAHPVPAAPEVSFEDQLRVFRTRFPGGFGDAGWIARHRVRPGRRSKGHADAAIAEARAALAADVLDRALDDDRAGSIHAASVAVLDQTSLVSGMQLQPLRALLPVRFGYFGQTLRDLLYGEGAYELRFERFVSALTPQRGPRPSWQLTTALPALVAPEEQVCVRPNTFREQAKWMAPRLVLGTTPSGAMYVRLAEMARAVQTALEGEGLSPRDLMDVHDFMVMSLAPSARDVLAN